MQLQVLETIFKTYPFDSGLEHVQNLNWDSSRNNEQLKTVKCELQMNDNSLSQSHGSDFNLMAENLEIRFKEALQNIWH